MAATGDPNVSPPVSVDRDVSISANSVFERITSEELWACTTCKACDEICPVNIEILDKILDMRRYLSLMESDFPVELGNTYRAMENTSNVYGMNQGERADWAKDLEGIDIVDASGPLGHEYLYWVGCAGSFDDRNKKTSRAVAKLLQRAGSTSRSSDRASSAPVTLRVARAMSTSFRCSRCRTSRRSMAWGSPRSSRSARIASTR